MKKITSLCFAALFALMMISSKNVQAQCTASFISAQMGGSVTGFTSTSVGTTSLTQYLWNFGNGSTYSATGNPGTATMTTYTANGTYTVTLCLFSSAPSCSSCVSQTINVTNSTNTCVANANFTMVPTSTPQHWNAIPATTATNIASATWYWGDNSQSSILYTSHQYSAAGTYTICLKIKLTCGDSATYCAPYAIYKSSDGSSSAVIFVNVVNPLTVGIAKNNGNSVHYQVYPNPASGSFIVEGNGLQNDRSTVMIFDLLGKKVYESEVAVQNNGFRKEVVLNGISEGVYLVKITSGEKTYMERVIIRE